MPLAGFVRLIKPLVRIRFGQIDSSRMGHFIGMCEIYHCEQQLGKHRGYRDFFYTTGKPINRFLLELFHKQLHFSILARFADDANRRLPGSEMHIVRMHAADYEGVLSRVSSSVQLEDGDLKASGDAWLESLGVSVKQPIVLFANRDPAFLQRAYPARDWSYHDYRDNSVGDFTTMAETMVAKGYAAIRMGSEVAEPLVHKNPMIIDYASSDRSEERDIYLAERCRMFIATTSGIADLGRLFRKPTAVANTVPFFTMVGFCFANCADLWIPKLHWSIEDKRLLNFSEIIKLGAGYFTYSEEYRAAGIELIDNTDEEIAEMALDIEDIICGKQLLDAEDRNLYRRFWEIVLPGDSCSWEVRQPIALSFLRRHPDLVS